MNKGVSHATGKYVIFMNGGDCFHSNNVLENVYNLNCKADVIDGITVAKGTNKPLRVNDDSDHGVSRTDPHDRVLVFCSKICAKNRKICRQLPVI